MWALRSLWIVSKHYNLSRINDAVILENTTLNVSNKTAGEMYI